MYFLVVMHVHAYTIIVFAASACSCLQQQLWWDGQFPYGTLLALLAGLRLPCLVVLGNLVYKLVPYVKRQSFCELLI